MKSISVITLKCNFYKITFSRPVVTNDADGLANSSLSFNRLLPKAKYMKRPRSDMLVQ